MRVVKPFIALWFILSSLAALATDVVVMRDGSERFGVLSLCEDPQCNLSGKRIPIAEIRAIYLDGPRKELPVRSSSIVMRDGSVRTGRVTFLNRGTVDTDDEELDRSLVAAIIFSVASEKAVSDQPGSFGAPPAPSPPPPAPPPRNVQPHRGALLGMPADAAPRHAPTLDRLGRAYAATCGSELTKVEAGQAVVVSATSRAALTAQVQETLAVGYVARLGRVQAVPWNENIPVRMAGGQTPDQIVQLLLVPGNIVVPVTWSFAGSAPIESCTIFAPSGEPLFDTFIAMPIVPGPLLAPRHF